ncbi:MAG TPA: nuclear transport factor 2 family protein [Solirubrobacteraceae bacterium]|nr:nuclear transport factor 2 family protein [Solirubrobacteraceae bacterium]
MGGEENLQSAQKAYAAFSSGDSEGAMENLADDVEWITPGNSSVSGTLRGKEEVGKFWGQLAEKGFSTSPEYWFSDDERVVVLTRVSIDGQEADQADVLTFRDGKVVKFQSAGDTALLEQVFGSK